MNHRCVIRVLRRTAIIATTIVAAHAVVNPATGNAQPSDVPCEMALSIVCRFLPIAPDWEGDVDLTVDQPAPDPSVPEPEFRKPADYCIRGCA